MTDEGLPADRLNRILTAVETIEESLGVLARKQQIDRKDYKNDSGARDIVERRFVKMTEAAIDIDEGLVKHERGQPPASNLASMRTLGELGVLSGSLVEEMAQGARFRNVLSHTYGNIIDHDIVYTGELPGKGFKPFQICGSSTFTTPAMNTSLRSTCRVTPVQKTTHHYQPRE
jgi:uncharacterized protein YutE (UPF0331/DUF86 family)